MSNRSRSSNVSNQRIESSSETPTSSDESLRPVKELSVPRVLREPAPLSTEPEAIRALKECDYDIKITLDMAKSGRTPRPVRVYADGVYDMFHSGHARQLMQASAVFPNTYLIVGVTSDADTQLYKGQTVMNEVERYEAVRHCRYVDEVITAAPWHCTIDFLKKHKIDFIAHDDIPYESVGSTDIYKPFKDAGMFLTTHRTEGISTTDVIGRILRDYDTYLKRNIRRGLTRHDLNISYVKEKQLRLENNLQTIVQKGSHFLGDIGSKRRRIVKGLEDLYQEFSASFVRFFGSRGSLQHWLFGASHTGCRAVTTSLPPSPVSITSSSTDADDDDGVTEGNGDNLAAGTSSSYNENRSRMATVRGSRKRTHFDYEVAMLCPSSGKRVRH